MEAIMYTDKLKVLLEKKFDRNNKPFFLGKLKFPGTIDFHEGVAIIVFTSEEGQEEVQFGVLKEGFKPGFETTEEDPEFTRR